MEEIIEEEKKTVLVVDDEVTIVELLKHHLELEGYNVLEANDGITGLETALNERPNLILLDIMLPKLDGLSVCKRIKNVYNVPILMITAKDTEIDKILGLELGADDYVTKPFSTRELMARVKANLRKYDAVLTENREEKKQEEQGKRQTENKIRVGDIILDLDKFEVRIKDEIIDLTLREFEVLKFLAMQTGQIVTREELLEKVWGYEYYGDIRTVDVTVRRIREKIEKDTTAPKRLITKRGIGYYLAAD
ncbi:MAG: response regulator transcription factor [Clostridia bacterium]|nr:response regulator transcription factor [Clostridia bacterium]